MVRCICVDTILYHMYYTLADLQWVRQIASHSVVK